jgi:tetratricopeptide (TPR) repeat protein
MVIKYEPLNRKDRIARLFREAIEAENRNDLETAKKKLDEILHESMEEEPELYFEACFRLAEVFIQEDNYRGAVKCALRAIYNAPNDDMFRLGFKRLGDVLAIIRDAGKSQELAENMDSIRALLKDDALLSSFLEALVKTAKGEEVSVEFPVKEMNEALKALKG